MARRGGRLGSYVAGLLRMHDVGAAHGLQPQLRGVPLRELLRFERPCSGRSTKPGTSAVAACLSAGNCSGTALQRDLMQVLCQRCEVGHTATDSHHEREARLTLTVEVFTGEAALGARHVAPNDKVRAAVVLRDVPQNMCSTTRLYKHRFTTDPKRAMWHTHVVTAVCAADRRDPSRLPPCRETGQVAR